MKIALVGINTKYTHSNLALKYLSEEVKDIHQCRVFDFTINDQKEALIHPLISGNYTHIGFSVYIWNVELVKELIIDIKEINPSIVIFLGGPEVSFESEEFLKESRADYLMVGEGETIFKDLVKHFLDKTPLKSPSILYMDQGQVRGSADYAISNIIPPIYKNPTYIEDNKYLYYEASRGCPYKCAFCLSAFYKATYFKDIATVKSELDLIIDKEVKIVKFIDRSFNYNPQFMEILNFIKDKDKGLTTFHFEIHPSLIDDKFIDLVKSSRPELFQFEIGLQTTNEKTAQEIYRAGNFKDIKNLCKSLNESQAHIHMDLIAGLPFEDLSSFKKSFNDLYSLSPEKIQLGFLKLLKGSRLRKLADEYDYKYFHKAPYEVISNKWMSYKDLIFLKAVEEMVERYYNEGYFKSTLTYLIQSYYKEPFDFYGDLASYWKDQGYLYTGKSRISLYNILNDFTKERWNEAYIKELIIYDYYKAGNNKSSAFDLTNYHKRYDKALVLDLIVSNSDRLLKMGIDPEKLLKTSVIEISPLDENMVLTEKDHYHVFTKTLGGKVKHTILKEGDK